MCPDVSSIVAANEVRLQSAEVNVKFLDVTSSVASIVKHKIQYVCTWNKTVLKDIHSEGAKLIKDRPLCKKVTEGYEDFNFPHWISGQYTVFNKMCKVALEQTLNAEKSELYERLQEILLSHESCLVHIHVNGDTCSIMRHNDFYVVVDCNVRNAHGLGSDIGTSVVVFNTNWHDLFLHIDALMVSLNAHTFIICGINVQVMTSDMSLYVNSDVDG